MTQNIKTGIFVGVAFVIMLVLAFVGTFAVIGLKERPLEYRLDSVDGN